MGNQHDEHDEHDEHEGALEGEILVYRPYPGSGYSQTDGRTGPRVTGPDIGHGHKQHDGRRAEGFGPGKKFGPRSYDEGLVREVIAYAVVHPYESMASIGRRFGVSAGSVGKWTRDDVDKRSSAVDTPRLRAEAAVNLEAVRNEAWALHQALKDAMGLPAAGQGLAEDGTPAPFTPPHPSYLKALMDALVRVESATATHAKLMGLNMPVKVDVQLTQLTEAERELQEMIDEATARTAAMEADVIAQASEDPDL